MQRRRYTVFRWRKAGGFRHEALYLESSDILIDRTREHEVRLMHLQQSGLDFSCAERLVIEGPWMSDEQIVSRAYELARMKRYSVASHNCEHFVRELVGARSESPQLHGVLIAAGLVACAFVATRRAA